MSQSIRRAVYKAKGLPDPGPSPTYMLVEYSLVVEKPLAKLIDEAHEMVRQIVPSRNDFLVELVRAGLVVMADAAVEAEKARQIQATPDEAPRPGIEITNEALPVEERNAISARLRQLRGEDLRAGGVAVERAG